MFKKGKAVSEDWSAARMEPLQWSAIAQPAATLPSEAMSSISSEMTVVGKIVCKGIIKMPLREVVWVILTHFQRAVFCCCCRCGHVGNALALSIMSTAMSAAWRG